MRQIKKPRQPQHSLHLLARTPEHLQYLHRPTSQFPISFVACLRKRVAKCRLACPHFHDRTAVPASGTIMPISCPLLQVSNQLFNGLVLLFLSYIITLAANTIPFQRSTPGSLPFPSTQFSLSSPLPLLQLHCPKPSNPHHHASTFSNGPRSPLAGTNHSCGVSSLPPKWLSRRAPSVSGMAPTSGYSGSRRNQQGGRVL